MRNKFFFRLTTVLPADKSNAPTAAPLRPRAKHTRLNNRTYACALVYLYACVYFSKFSVPFFYFFLFFFCLRLPPVFPLRQQFIYVHYFRSPDFYSPFGVFSLETRVSRASTMRLANAFWPVQAIIYCIAPITYAPTLTARVLSLSTWLGTQNCFYSKPRFRKSSLKLFEKIVDSGV